jgi:DNA processing protein
MSERAARLALSCVVEPATTAVTEQVARSGAEQVWDELRRGSGRETVTRRAREFRSESVIARAEAAGMRFVIPGDPEWPLGLADLEGCEPVNDLSGPPLGLWVRGGGELAALARRSAAIVGARACSSYGETIASELAAELGRSGVATVSGGAYGIDAAAHRGCLASRSPTVAVLACGLDHAYPPAHRSLFERIAEDGVLVSEFAPGAHPTRVRFLGRNRLIAAMTQITVIVEAAVRSGARNTVTWANCLNRVVAAVPGSIYSAQSYTPHRLIREAEAVLVSNAAEVLELLAPLGRGVPRAKSEHRVTDDFSPEQLAVFEAVPSRGGLSVEELSLRSGVPLAHCLGILDELAEQGVVEQDESWQWRLPRRRRAQTPLF